MARAPIKWHVGCSGFYYPEWKGDFYPSSLPQGKWFEHYGTVFDSLELNNSFYRFPTEGSLKRWYTLSPENFSFSVKVPRSITHYRQFVDCGTLLSDFYNIIGEGLQEKLATILFQLPPDFGYTMERLERIIQSVDTAFMNVVEFRDSSWWQPVVYAALAKKKIIFSGISHPGMPDETVVNGTFAYYRFHGVPRLYYSSYDEATLADKAGQLQADNKLKEAFVYFNNTAAKSAIKNALWFKAFVEGRTRPLRSRNNFV